MRDMVTARLIGSIAAVSLLVTVFAPALPRDAGAASSTFGGEDFSRLAARHAASTGWSGVYKMHRRGLRVRLEVRNASIVSIKVWVVARCSDGFKGGGRLTLDDPVSWIQIRRDGRFDKFLVNRHRSRSRLAGRIRGQAIVGFYLEWYIEGHSTLCGTGQPGKRALRFVARR